MIKVHVNPIPETLSQAMWRVANALRAHAPDCVQIVNRVKDADVEVLHVIGLDAIAYARAHPERRFVTIQYCYKTAGHPDPTWWMPLWEQSRMVWSYYDLPAPRFYHSPLGIDAPFLENHPPVARDSAMTSGFVHGFGAEAIEEFTRASEAVGLRSLHLGPAPLNMQYFPAGWKSVFGCDDRDLANHYRRSRFVSGLRWVEGFEMPVVEGLSCGAIPICFDRPEARRWFDGFALFVPETADSDALTAAIAAEMAAHRYSSLSPERVAAARERFSWATIAGGFWTRLLEAL